MKLLPIIAAMFILTSCGKEYIDNSTFTEKFVENPYTAPESPDYALSFSNFDVTCTSYKGTNTFKRANSILRMDVSIHSETTTLLNLGWSTIITLEQIDGIGVILVNGTEMGEIELTEKISLQVIAENGIVILQVGDLESDLEIEVIPENVVYCHPDGKVVENIQILDKLEF